MFLGTLVSWANFKRQRERKNLEIFKMQKTVLKTFNMSFYQLLTENVQFIYESYACVQTQNHNEK